MTDCDLCQGTRTIGRLGANGRPDGYRYPCPACQNLGPDARLVAVSGPSTQTCTCNRCGLTLGRNPRPHPCRRRRIKQWLRRHHQNPRKPSDD